LTRTRASTTGPWSRSTSNMVSIWRLQRDDCALACYYGSSWLLPMQSWKTHAHMQK
jgi:hypothetical protein